MTVKRAFILFIILLLAACSGNDSSSEQLASESKTDEEQADSAAANTEQAEPSKEPSSRMISYEGQMEIAVKGVEDAAAAFEQQAEQTGGYLVESSITSDEKDRKTAQLHVRIPSNQFQDYLTYIEKQSEQVLNRNVRGEDVTEEYVDLESRLKAKRAVEKRLLAFMEEAQKTEELLKISNDLARVQEEIEQVEGRMKYLQNRTDFAAVSLTIQDQAIHIPNMKSNEDLQTGQKIKQAFAASLNAIAQFFSGLAVLVVGYSPLLVLLGGIGFVIYYFIRKRRK